MTGAIIDELPAADGPVVLRRAREGDLPALVALLADDQLGATRESVTDLIPYRSAFAAIDADPAHLLLVADRAGEVVGTLQLTLLPGLARSGAWRAQIEAVRVHSGLRGQRVGERMLRWAIEESARRGATIVQLTTDKRRADAHRFYERLGFVASHEGMKLQLDCSERA